MAKVTGIGGIFFKSKNPESLIDWYRKNLGLVPDQEGGLSFLWREKEKPERIGRTVWAAFPANTKYFDPGQSSFMFNFRVDNLEELLADLKAKGVQIEDKIEDYEYGRFGWFIDAEGNKVELWEPKGEAGTSKVENSA